MNLHGEPTQASKRRCMRKQKCRGGEMMEMGRANENDQERKSHMEKSDMGGKRDSWPTEKEEEKLRKKERSVIMYTSVVKIILFLQ